MDMFWVVSREYIAYIKDMTGQIDAIERQVVSSTENTLLYRLIALNKSLIFFDTAIHGNSQILKAIEEESEDHALSAQERAFLRDIQIEHRQAWTLVDQYKELVDKITVVLSNVISNNMNIVMKRLTGWTILLTVPTITAGLWGMNVLLPFQENPSGFSLVLGLTALFMGVVFVWLRSKNHM